MKLTELLLEELDREAPGIRKALERVPEGKNDWKPHEKSSTMGGLATHLATLPTWALHSIELNELDIAPGGVPVRTEPLRVL